MEPLGFFRDILQAPDKRTIYDSGWRSNTIVNRCRILLALFMRNEPSLGIGIQYLAVGQGEVAWDADGAGLPGSDTTKLVGPYSETIPADKLKWAFLNENDEEVDGPTNRLQITATLDPGYPPPLESLTTYPLREFGLFGRYDNTDYMINCVRHAVIHKDASATLKRVIRLYF